MISEWPYELPLAIVIPLCLAVILAASAAGWRLGAGLRGRGENPAGPHIATLQGALFGLLSLMIGFTFSIALTRFDARQEALLAEANAIDTALLRTQLLPEPFAAETRQLLRRYVDRRLAIGAESSTPAVRDEAVAASADLLDELWRQAVAAMARDATGAPPRLFVEALNEVGSLHLKRVAADRLRVPDLAFALLYALAVLTLGLAGFAGGVSARRGFGPIAVTGLAMAALIVMVADLDRPYHGLIAVSQQPLIDLRATFAR